MDVVTVPDRLEQALRKRPKKERSWASVARDAGVPAGWLRSFATGHITQGDPQRIKAVSEELGIDYREMLALTDQLGEVETVERATTPAPPPDLATLVQLVTAQQAQIKALTDAVENLTRAIATDRQGPPWLDDAVPAAAAYFVNALRATRGKASDG